MNLKITLSLLMSNYFQKSELKISSKFNRFYIYVFFIENESWQSSFPGEMKIHFVIILECASLKSSNIYILLEKYMNISLSVNPAL